jgi:hypothetical protein
MKLKYKFLACWPELQFMSFHLFPLSGLRYKIGDTLMQGKVEWGWNSSGCSKSCRQEAEALSKVP